VASSPDPCVAGSGAGGGGGGVGEGMGDMFVCRWSQELTKQATLQQCGGHTVTLFKA